ncbi:MAG: alpha/beta hydrolase [Acidobacteriota bacterium]
MTRFHPLFALGLLLASLATPMLAESVVVTLRAPDGVELKATYTAAEKPGPGVLLLHMCNSDRSAWQGLAAKLAVRGIHSLALDYRGYGDSGGTLPDGPGRGLLIDETWPGDIDTAFEYLRSRPEVHAQRLGAAGGSCGVDNAVDLARRHPGEVKTLVLLAGTTDRDGEAFLAENAWLPVLASASRDDGQAVELTRWTLGFSSHPANRFLEYETGGHGTEMFAVHDQLEPSIAGWFLEHLIRNPARKSVVAKSEPGPSIKLWNALTEPDGVARVTEGLQQARARGKAIPLPPEGVINAEGYRLLGAGDLDQAIELLGFNVEAFPESANALDSLSDAYLANGQRQKALALAQQALEALPNDTALSDDFRRAVEESARRKLAEAAAAGTE